MTAEHINFLKRSDLFDYITIDELNKKIAGEIPTRRAIFLSLCGIFVQGVQLNTLVNSESSAGKSYVCRTIIMNLFPDNLYEYRTKISPEAFTYWKNKEHGWSWDGKICYVEDVSQALLDSPTFRVMCSEGSVASVVRNQDTIDIIIRGKPNLLLTTATTNPSHEILNRFNMVGLDESNKQTRKVMEKIASIHSLDLKEEINSQIKEAIKELKRVKVCIPYIKKITKYFPDNLIRIRRDFTRFCDLIKASAAIHQYQRKKNGHGEIEANCQDYELARESMAAIQSESSSFGLTTRLKKAYAACESLYKKIGVPFTVKEVYAHEPFVNERMWYIYLNKLVSDYKLLTISLEHKDDVKQSVRCYIPSNKMTFALPNFDELLTNVTIDTKVTKVTKVTKDKNNCNNCNNYTDFGASDEQNPPIEIIKIGKKEV